MHVIETRRLDLPATSSPAEIYQWFFIEDRIIHRLNFESMSLTPQQRIFQEGMIEFDLLSCHGRLMQKDLELTSQDKVSGSLRNLIEQELKAKG